MIDDHEVGIDWERKVLEAMGATVVHAATSEAASAILDGATFDLVISDIRRGDRRDEGVRFAADQGVAETTPLLVYVYRLNERPPPAGAFAITNDAVQLFHLVCDVLERQRA